MKRKFKLLIYIFLLMVLLGSCTKYEFQEEVEAVVIDKEYEESYTTLVPMITSNGKTTTTVMRPQYHPEKYCVKLKHKELTTSIDNKELYEKIKVRNKIKVNLYRKKDKEKIRYMK